MLSVTQPINWIRLTLPHLYAERLYNNNPIHDAKDWFLGNYNFHSLHVEFEIENYGPRF